MKRLILAGAIALSCGGCFSGCATHNATTLVKALKNDPAGFSLNVVGWGANIHIVRANPGADSPPYTLTQDGTVQVSPQVPVSAMPNEVLLQTLRKVPNQPSQ
jgi:hypothetical protein